MLNNGVLLSESNQIKLRHVYKCRGCSSQQVGECRTLEIRPGVVLMIK